MLVWIKWLYIFNTLNVSIMYWKLVLPLVPRSCHLDQIKREKLQPRNGHYICSGRFTQTFAAILISHKTGECLPIMQCKLMIRSTSAHLIDCKRARSIQQKFPEISVQNLMDRFGPTEKVSKKRVRERQTTFSGRTGWIFGWMDRAVWVSVSNKSFQAYIT